MVFCAYCGKSFTRKEHLERHIPSHTNVKPHRCSACQLSFARRDLLQRHHSTYHEARDPMEPLPGGVPTVAGRTPIACQNCANAKTGCDKRVPCARCAEKNLPCAARFARRSSKAAVRAAQATAVAAVAAAATNAGDSGCSAFPQTNVSTQTTTPSAFDVDGSQRSLLPTPPDMDLLQSPLSLEHMVVGGATGLSMNCLVGPDGLQQQATHLQHLQPQQQLFAQQQQHDGTPATAHRPLPFSPEDSFATPHRPVEAFDEFMGFSPDPTAYQGLLWTDYNMGLDLDLYTANPVSMATSTISAAVASVGVGLVPPFTASTDLSDVSSGSEPMTVASSSQGSSSLHTRGTSATSSGSGAEVNWVNNTHRSNSSHDLGSLGLADGGGGTLIFSSPPYLTQKPPLLLDQFHSRSLLATSSHAADPGIPEFEVVLAAEAAWPLARCTPPIFSGACPRTAIVHLECLEQKSKEEGTWNALEQFLAQDPPATASEATPHVVPLTARSRDKLLAVTQGFLHKALDIHRSGVFSGPSGHGGGGSSNGSLSPGAPDVTFLVLPPSNILEYFLRSYVHSLMLYFPLIVGGVVDPNEMLDNSQAASLLVLLMIAQGAATVPMAEARYLSAGLSETCRISLFDLIEKNVELCADPTTLRGALLFTLLGTWSGDKWQMDIAMGQRSMYLMMLKHAGMLEPQMPWALGRAASPANAELQWRSWLQRETQNRTIWPPLPIALPTRLSILSPQQLRLLLHPLQSIICHLRQMLACLPEDVSPSTTTTADSADGLWTTAAPVAARTAILQQLADVQAQLQHWYTLASAQNDARPACSATRCNLVLYHLVALNAVAHVPTIERLARREVPATLTMVAACFTSRHDAIVHCGQIMCLLRQLSPARRPSWWSAALYRAVLVLWAVSVWKQRQYTQDRRQRHQRRQKQGMLARDPADTSPERVSSPSSPSQAPTARIVAIDRAKPDDPAVRSLRDGSDSDVVAVLTRTDGTGLSLDSPTDILRYGIQRLDEASSTRISDGIRRKLVTLAAHWGEAV